MYLGIDLGTSEIKLLLLANDQRIVATTGAPLTLQRPQPLWSEQQPADWWAALDAAMAQLKRQVPQALGDVRAIGLSGQMHGAVLLDAAGQVLRPAILWNDGRSGAECAALEAAVPALHQIAGNLAMPGFTAPKLMWVRRHEPELFARVATVLLPKDWLRFKLSGGGIGSEGEKASDASDASGTLWLDVAARRWSPTVLAACGLAEAQMPRVVEGSDVAGHLHETLARRWGLPAGIAIAGGGGDNAASAVGIGATAPGQGFVSLGTSGVIFVTGSRYRPNPPAAVHAFCHALPGRWHQMSVMLSAASALRWTKDATGAASEAALVAEAEALSPAERERAPIFLPYLGGERTPHNNPEAQAAFIGLTHAHGRGHLAQAVLEGVSFGLLDGWFALDADERARVQSLSLVGGGARSAHWARLLATLIDRPLLLREGGETGAALGAARLAWLAEQGLRADEAAICAAAPVRQAHEPVPAWREALLARYARFRQLYPRLNGPR
ncbi:xylulokinase [Aquabacterium sp. OR-4]|uniref:xylulokinase n=1 Tax=Aquabacterium sp. OR-4 TaxID=2978127 RepID=UPI0021B4326E|nr:xylulokinase [Aquabacterium sp. OR-4]MDT7838247.1 xylulokinase [Aquabacterium sp. OR-4]